MSRLWRWLAAILTLAGMRRRHRERREERERDRARIVPKGTPQPGAETAVLVLLALCALSAAGFVVVYAFDELGNRTQLLGIALGGALLFAAAALILFGHRLVVTEELEDDYPPEEHPEEQQVLAQVIEDSTSRLTRKRLLLAAGGTAGGAMSLAMLTPAISLGPIFETDPLFESPWRRGRRLVDEEETPYRADDIEADTFYTAFPEGSSHDQIGAPLVLVRVEPARLQLPAGREDWAPGGILAYSKICTHAGCAISIYRTPLFEPVEPTPALVCPCHYSTFDVATGAEVVFGPAGRPLPQLPLAVDDEGVLRAGGNLSGPPGPSWQRVRHDPYR